MRLTGRLIPGSTLLQVVNVHSYVKGKLHEVYYWCDICTIRGLSSRAFAIVAAEPMEFAKCRQTAVS